MSDFAFEFVHFTPPPVPSQEISMAPDINILPTKRRPGRPLGSKTVKKPRIDPGSDEDCVQKRKPGRPRGTGSKQQAQAQATAVVRSREIQWKPGLPLRIPGVPSHSLLRKNGSRDVISSTPALPSSQSHSAVGSVAPENPPQPQNSREHGYSTVDHVRDLAHAELTGDKHTTHETVSIAMQMDPVHVIDDVDNDTILNSFVSEGLGDDDDLEDDNDSEPRADQGEGKNHRRSYPSWFLKLFEKIVLELDMDRRALKGQTRHYAAGTFWLPRKAVWFHLKKQDLTPSDVFLPEFFLWDPAELLGGSMIPCPACGCVLTRDGLVKRPRRVVDIDSCFWIIGYTYKCRRSSTGGCGTKFRSWDSRILGKLPRPLAMEFPACLTWRSGLSWRAFGVVRSCIQRGMGTSEVAEMFRMQHLRRYDELRLQYLYTKVSQMNIPCQTYTPFLPFTDTSDQGFHGFTPSGQWFRDVYDDVIEGYRDTLNQHTAMLSGRVCAIDHSHKIAKHIFKVNGVPIFTALLTVTNELGEIRVCLFVATKSHSQYSDALKNMSKDLARFGHDQPALFYTDNMSDKGMLESIFSSLLEDVVAVEKHSHLPLFALPSSIVPQVLHSVSEINNTMRSILDDISPSGPIVVGFDSEWNVDVGSSGRIVGHDPPSVIQIAYKTQVYILQISEMLASRQLPHELINLLYDDKVMKVGRLVNGDLRQLALATGHQSTAFKGGLDLAMYAKQKLLITDARLSLADLTAAILGKYLPKSQVERISNNWSDQDLSDTQIEYAARDAYVALCLYNKIADLPQPSPLPPTVADVIGRSVVIMTEDRKRIAARGIISQATTSTAIDNINITATRAVVSIHEVLIPATIMLQHRRRPLQEMGPTPFDVVVHRSSVQLIDIEPVISHHCPSPAPADNSVSASTSPISPDVASSLDDEQSYQEVPDGVPVGETINQTVDLQLDSESGAIDNNNGLDSACETDESSKALGAETLGPRTLDADAFKTPIRSRVLKDVFHVFNMLYISRSHGLRIPFSQALRDAILVPNLDDKARIEGWLHIKGVTWDHMLRYNSSWLWRRCRRIVPPPEELYTLVHDVFMTWGPLKDAKTGLSLFNKAAWKVSKNILELVLHGYVSDPPSVSLYYIIGLDKRADGLPIYRCIRGTNLVEGGVHTHLRKMLPSCGASVRHMVNCLLDFILRHNLLVGTFNSTGKKFDGHDSIWLSNTIQELEITLSTIYSLPPIQLSWVNGNLYQKSDETMGLTAISKSVRIEAGMQDFVEETDATQKQAYLARIQGTRRPILPVHTIAERKLFNRLMRESHEFRSSKSSISINAVKLWNRYAETEDDIFYKLEEQLTSHFNGKWQDVANSIQSICQAKPFTKNLEQRLQDPKRPSRIVNPPADQMTPHCVTEGFAELQGIVASTCLTPTHTDHTPAMAAVKMFANTNKVPIQAAHATLIHGKTDPVHGVGKMPVTDDNLGIDASTRAGTVTLLVLLIALDVSQITGPRDGIRVAITVYY
ncbi:hypothetical protein H0H92_002998 [Tricholoma furcatifolium]|nr:hypothetical protein H0H92_002998 [Tricholoma furcatifolium]